ncbi:HAD-IC family P-type ATPase [Streptosporangium sp. DT93]|uniref:cation-translocating P-type ATPase n=1 Tax=Streptosporangium sp. DT93 TaxID=3393428 RepID=UPI003CFAA6F0
MFMPRLLSPPAHALRGVMPEVVRGLLPRSRGRRACPGGVRVDLRTIGGPGTEGRARRLEDALLRLEGIGRAEVNGVLGSVFVGCASGSIDLEKVLELVEAFDDDDAECDEDTTDEDGTDDNDTDDDTDEAADDIDTDDGPESAKDPSAGPAALVSMIAEHHAAKLVERHARAGVRLGATLLGAGLAVAGRAVRAPSLPAIVPALLNLAEATPKVRSELERRLGTSTTFDLLVTANIVTHTLALRPLGMLIQSATAAGNYLEARDTRRAWEAREHDLSSADGSYRHTRAPRTPRPAPLKHSPVERFERAASPAAVGFSGLTQLLGRDRRRTIAALTATTPKAAKQGRESFASSIARALAARGAIVLDPRALRQMDGVDTVVLDADVLGTGSWEIDHVIPLTVEAAGTSRPDEANEANEANEASLPNKADGTGRPDGRNERDRKDEENQGDRKDADGLRARLHSLLDLTDPGARRERDGWTAEPIQAPAVLVSAEAAGWEMRGLRAVRVSRRGVPVALVGMAPGVDPVADAVVAAATAGGVCAVLLAGGGPELGARLGVGESVPGGPRLARSVRALQAEGHGVAVVSARRMAALAQADLGIGVSGRSRRTPWDADVVAELEEAHLLLSCLAPARRTSERVVWLTGAGTAIGGALTTFGPAARVLDRAQLVSDFTAIATVATGEWAGWRAGREAPPVRNDRTPWHAMRVEDVFSLLKSSPGGITEDEAALRRTSARSRRPQGPPSLLRASLEELANPMTPILAAGAGLSAMVGSASDAVMIATVVAANAFIGGGQRFSADRALSRLTEAVATPVRVRRPQRPVSTTVDGLVPGDVIELRAGDTVPADCRVFRATNLEMDESALTGESQLVTKSPAPVDAPAVADRTSMVYEGTTVAAGVGLAMVVAAGESTEAARTARLTEKRPPASGVQLRLRELSRRILPVALGSGVVLLVADLMRGRSLPAALAPAVSLAVAAVPEGLPFVASVAELAAARRLSTRNTLVPNPSTIEALGRVNVLCFDKTGTLTEGRISLRCVSDGQDERPVEALTPELRRIVAAGLRAGPRHDDGRPVPHPTDRAVLNGAERLGVTPEEGGGGWERVDELPFEPGRGYHAVLGTGGSGPLLSVKGAPEIVVTRCASVLRDGRVVPLTDVVEAELHKELDQLARQGYRVLAVAERAASDRRDLDESRIQDLCFLGFLGLADPVRPTAAESVGRLTRAGVRIVMITGDHPSTAEAIAAELNVLNGGRIMTGPELDALDDDTLVEALPDVTVFARTSPAHKARIVECLRRAGKVVAVTGDGANDAPAIRGADVGIALGSRATPAARSAADIVVTDDRIETIVDAIIEGRAMWSSVRDALSILLGGNIGEIVFAVGSSLISGANVLNTRQLLLVNLLTDMLPAMAVAARPPAATSPERLLQEGPEASLGASLTRDIQLRAVTTAGAAGAAWAIGRLTGTRGRADTMGLVALVATQLLQTLVMGSRDRMVVLASLVSLAVLGLTVSVPGLCRFFGCHFLGPAGWAVALSSAAASTAAAMAFQAVTQESDQGPDLGAAT